MAVEKFMQKNDYEKYEIIMPFTAFVGKRRKQFVCSELEKMHPCFSDEYAFDTEIKKISRKGLCTDVLVMNKFKLAEYEGKRRFSGTGFYIDKHRYFVNKKWKLAIGTIMACLIVICVGLISGVLAGTSYKAVQKTETLLAGSLAENLSEVQEITNGLDEKAFFDVINAEGGKINSLEWTLKGYVKNLKASVTGVYPEKLRDVSGNSVIYENGIPHLNVSSSSKIIFQNVATEKSKSVLSNSDFNKTVREVITSCGAALKEENAPPYHIEFILFKGNESQRLFTELNQIIKNDNRAVTAVSLNQTSVNELHAGISIEESTSPDTGFDLALLSENLKLFFGNSVINKVQKSATAKRNSENQKSNLQIIGEIKRPDNSIVVFYKTAEGKIEKRIQEGEAAK